MANPTLFDLEEYQVAKPSQDLDIIFTTRPTDPVAWVATDLGVKIGCNSSDNRIYDTEKYLWNFKIEFIDNDFRRYDHAKHSKAVEFIKPKYATVRDIMTEKQCEVESKRIGKTVEYYPLEQILEWAADLKRLSPKTNIIVIPKYDCLKKIKGNYVLGFSIPTSHGATPLDEELFKGRPVHLLGGRFDEQVKRLNILGEDIVSLDTNQISLIAQYGDYIIPDGTRKTAKKNGLGFIQKPRVAALTLSLNAVVARIKHYHEYNQ